MKSPREKLTMLLNAMTMSLRDDETARILTAVIKEILEEEGD